MSTRYAAQLEDVRAASERISGLAHRTPVVTCETLDRLASRRLFFKCEHLQKAGAFKFRGASNMLARLDREKASRGVVTHSSGNHAQALALAASQREIPATVVMPENALRVKRQAVLDYGARVITCTPTLEAREEACRRLLDDTGGTLVHPYDDPDVIAGQGTVALELLDQVADLDAIVVPVGGGGLASGVCVAARGLAPEVRVIAAEPTGADDAARSLASGRLVPQTAPKTIADGLRTSLGKHTWPILRDHLDRVVTVGEDEIRSAMRLAWERAKLLIEPSSAVALAALLGDELRGTAGLGRVGVVLTGGNVDLERLPW